MLNTIYEKIKKFIKENYKIIIFFLIFIVLFNINLDYEIYSSGGIINPDDRIHIKNANEMEGSFNLTYVSAKKGVLPFVLLSYIIKDWDLVSLDESRIENENYDEIVKRNKIYLEEGINNSIISAFEEANEKYEIKTQKIKVLYKLENANTDIMVGDEIIEVNGVKVNNSKNFTEEINKYNENEEVKIKVIRNDKEISTTAVVKEEENKKIIGLYLTTIYDINTFGKIEVNYKNNEGGSSGGLINALYIYNSLTKYDLTKGIKIAGTGTIDENGTVGSIGGVKYKLLGAEKKHAKVFLVPNENYNEAKKVKDDNNLKIDLIKVGTLKEAINKLKIYNPTK